MDKRTLRKLHRTLAPIIFLPFLVTAITGIIYRIGNSWFGMPREYSQLMLSIHQGTYLGEQLRPIYVLLNGLGLIGMVVTGIVMSGIFRRSRTQE
ncbi:hypothetical protein [Lyngbya aestuarii]|uniref:hypothetical protein n=1 Tax=Lyngbya aestuarii TaxID=118322 RepID=UPI00403DFF2A